MGAQLRQAREDQFLGCLLGLAIGDAIGRPVAGLKAEDIRSIHGAVTGYLPQGSQSAEPVQGEITGITEIALCIVESVTTNNGMIDPENINARLGYLVSGPSRAWMSDSVVAGIARAAAASGLVDDEPGCETELAVALRGVPVGLLHAVGGYDDAALAADAALASRLSHGSRQQANLVRTVARIVVRAARFRERTPSSDVDGDGPAAVAVRSTLDAIIAAGTFEEAVTASVSLGGATHELGALAGAIEGARVGASGIPQDLIDGLDARIYLTLAAPWFYRAALRRAGTVIDLRTLG